MQNDQFYVGNCGYANENGFKEFGVPYNAGDSEDNREALTELMEVLGKPSVVAICSNGFLSYVDRGDYILELQVYELAIKMQSFSRASKIMNAERWLK